jgi:two-component system LytT family sensor kinase
MKRNTVWMHIAVWAVLYIFWITVFQNHAFVYYRTLSVEFCYLVFIAANFYFAVYYAAPKFLYQKKYAGFVLLLLGGITVGALLRVPLANYLNSHFFAVGRPQPGVVQLFINSFVNIFLWVVCAVAVRLIIDRIRFQQYVAVIEKEKSKTELDFLKAQFNPHFLFNSINSIYGHIEKGNATARSMLLTFSEMLRYQLYECNTDSISIDKEINYIRNYVLLQQSRKEDTLVVNLCINDSVKGFAIAPLLFIAFIENAFKYVSNYETCENKVDISMNRSGNGLSFRSFNTKDASHVIAMDRKGIGIVNVKRRLELMYPDRHTLSITDEPSFYEVQLNLVL